jgi:UDPglucose 6-dehydrogenase
VAILGLAYKPLSHVIEESQAMMMAKAFLEHGARVLAYDPLAGESANLELGGRALIMDNARDCLRDADVVLIATPDPEFKTLTPRDFRGDGQPVLVVDFWRILSDQLSGAKGIEYVAYGRGAATVGTDVFKQLWGATPTHYGR